MCIVLHVEQIARAFVISSPRFFLIFISTPQGPGNFSPEKIIIIIQQSRLTVVTCVCLLQQGEVCVVRLDNIFIGGRVRRQQVETIGRETATGIRSSGRRLKIFKEISINIQQQKLSTICGVEEEEEDVIFVK
jgi:hypothetical protein